MAIFEDALGSRSTPHVESADSDENSSDSDVESSESEEDIEELNSSNDSNSTCFIVTDGTKLWTPKCDDKHKPYLNQYFPTLQDAYVFYRDYGRICDFDVRKSTKKSDRKRNLLAKYVMCNRGGSPYQNRSKAYDDHVVEGTHTRRRTTSRRCNCKEKIIMRPAGVGDFVLTSFVEEHNHPLVSKAGRMFLRCNRNVSIDQQNFIMDCSRAKIGATMSHSLVKEMVGSYEDVGATVADFKNFSRDVKVRIGDHDTDMILAKFKLKKETSNNNFYYDYKVDKKGHLTCLFWTDAISQANYEVFGDIISFDPTFRTNRYNMVFVPFTGVDNHWKNVTFAAGLLAKENYKNFKWLINTFKTAMGRVPACVITDQCPAIKKALKNIGSLQNIGSVGPALATNKKFMDKFKSVVYTDHLTPGEFEEGWKTVISEYNLQRNVWLTDMFNIRDQWIPAYFSNIEMAGLLGTTSRSESSNNFFQHFHESGDMLVEFYSSFESAMDKQRLRNADDDKRSEQIPHMETTMTIENDASHLYTLELYYLVREEIKSACYHTIMYDMTKDNESRYFKYKDELLCGKIFEISVRLSDNHVQCNCKFYFRRGYLCRHAFAALHQCSIHKILREFVKPRWTKNAVKHHSTLGSSQVPADLEKRDRIKLKRTRAWFEFHNCMNYAGEDEDKLDLVITGLHTISSKLSKKSDNIEDQANVHRADKFIDPIPGSEITIRNPHISRNKECGSRIKSSQEISVEVGKGKKCSKCGKTTGHNARSCPQNKQSE